jgi:hypothetical protein
MALGGMVPWAVFLRQSALLFEDRKASVVIFCATFLAKDIYSIVDPSSASDRQQRGG